MSASPGEAMYVDPENARVIEVCVTFLLGEAASFLRTAEMEPGESAALISAATSAEVAAEQLRRLISGSAGPPPSLITRWLDQWDSGTARQPPFLAGVRPSVTSSSAGRSNMAVLSDVRHGRLIEECARHLDARADAYLARQRHARVLPVIRGWLQIGIDTAVLAGDLRLLTAEGREREEREYCLMGSKRHARDGPGLAAVGRDSQLAPPSRRRTRTRRRRRTGHEIGASCQCSTAPGRPGAKMTVYEGSMSGHSLTMPPGPPSRRVRSRRRPGLITPS